MITKAKRSIQTTFEWLLEGLKATPKLEPYAAAAKWLSSYETLGPRVERIVRNVNALPPLAAMFASPVIALARAFGERFDPSLKELPRLTQLSAKIGVGHKWSPAEIQEVAKILFVILQVVALADAIEREAKQLEKLTKRRRRRRLRAS